MELNHKSFETAQAIRAANRTSVLLSARLISVLGIATVRVKDLSTTGAHIIDVEGLAIGDDVAFHCRDDFHVAEIVWIKGREAGLRFYRGEGLGPQSLAA